MKPQSRSVNNKDLIIDKVRQDNLVGELLEELDENKPEEVDSENYDDSLYLRGEVSNPYSPSLSSDTTFHDGKDTLNLKLDYEIVEVGGDGERRTVADETCYYDASVWRAFDLEEMAREGRYIEEINQEGTSVEVEEVNKEIEAD